MTNKWYLLTLLLVASFCPFVQAAESKPVYTWVSANEYYFILPTAQDLHIAGNGTESVKPWGFGFRAVGHETFSKTGGLQVQSIKVDNPSTGKDTFYLWEILAGMQYTSPKVQVRIPGQSKPPFQSKPNHCSDAKQTSIPIKAATPVSGCSSYLLKRRRVTMFDGIYPKRRFHAQHEVTHAQNKRSPAVTQRLWL